MLLNLKAVLHIQINWMYMQSETVNFIRLEKHNQDSYKIFPTKNILTQNCHTLLFKVLYIIYNQAVMQKYHMEEIKICKLTKPLRHANMGRLTHLKI